MAKRKRVKRPSRELRSALRALAAAKRVGTVPWKQLKKELGL